MPARWIREAWWARAVLFPFLGHGCAWWRLTLAPSWTLRGFKNVGLKPRVAGAELFNPRTKVDFPWPRPIFFDGGPGGDRKEILEAFLALDRLAQS